MPTFLPQVQRLRASFSIGQLVTVGDRGMIGHKDNRRAARLGGIGWIMALKNVSIRTLVEQGQWQLGLFDERSLMERSSPEDPGERLVACRNPQLAKLRALKREELLAAPKRACRRLAIYSPSYGPSAPLTGLASG